MLPGLETDATEMQCDQLHNPLRRDNPSATLCVNLCERVVMDSEGILPSEASAPAWPRVVTREHATNSTIRKIGGFYKKYAETLGTRTRIYILVSLWAIFCTAIHLYIVTSVFSNTILFFSYYVVNYKFGFVRRGLAGELLGMFPEQQYFTAAYLVLWASIAIWLLALIWLSVSTGARSERRIMLAIAVPVLPFAFSYAVYNTHPEILGMAALLALCMALSRTSNNRTRMILAAVYGAVTAVLALVHEAIPLEFALGAVLAILVLGKDATRAIQRICTALAVGPGVLMVLLIAKLGRRDVSAQLCAQVPHGMVEDPWAVSTTPGQTVHYLLGGVQAESDYHDWICRNLTPVLDVDMAGAVHLVARFRFWWLSESFLIGVVLFALSIGLIGYLSAVPVRNFVDELRGSLWLPALALGLQVPLFAVAVDWARWWILISFDVAVVYILYAITTPEIERPPTRRQVVVFVCAVVVLALLPTGSTSNAGAPGVLTP